jgi:hypothetical protein
MLHHQKAILNELQHRNQQPTQETVNENVLFHGRVRVIKREDQPSPAFFCIAFNVSGMNEVMWCISS